MHLSSCQHPSSVTGWVPMYFSQISLIWIQHPSQLPRFQPLPALSHSVNLLWLPQPHIPSFISSTDVALISVFLAQLTRSIVLDFDSTVKLGYFLVYHQALVGLVLELLLIWVVACHFLHPMVLWSSQPHCPLIILLNPATLLQSITSITWSPQTASVAKCSVCI